MWANNNYTFSSYQKLQIQEKAAQEVKLAIKPFYQNKDITKEEYKEIVRKAVDKVSSSFSRVIYVIVLSHLYFNKGMLTSN